MRNALRQATPYLRDCFGEETIYNLELSIDEDDGCTLFALAVWKADARSGSRALSHFLESWWLDQMDDSTADLAFAYKLV